MFRSGGASTSCGGRKLNGGHGLTADELEVAKILFSLPCLIYSNVRWASKKKRSGNRSHKPPAPVSSKRKSNSPSTPLDFPDDSDDNTENKVLKRKFREKELREDIDRLEKRTKLCTEVIDDVLRAKKLELLQLIFDVDLTESENPQEIRPKTSSPSTSGDDDHQEEPIKGLGSSTTVLFTCPVNQVGPLSPSPVGFHLPNDVGPIAIPDLNLPAAEKECFWGSISTVASRVKDAYTNEGEDDE